MHLLITILVVVLLSLGGAALVNLFAPFWLAVSTGILIFLIISGFVGMLIYNATLHGLGEEFDPEYHWEDEREDFVHLGDRT